MRNLPACLLIDTYGLEHDDRDPGPTPRGARESTCAFSSAVGQMLGLGVTAPTGAGKGKSPQRSPVKVVVSGCRNRSCCRSKMDLTNTRALAPPKDLLSCNPEVKKESPTMATAAPQAKGWLEGSRSPGAGDFSPASAQFDAGDESSMCEINDFYWEPDATRRARVRTEERPAKK